jgi:hypothetical protein
MPGELIRGCGGQLGRRLGDCGCGRWRLLGWLMMAVLPCGGWSGPDRRAQAADPPAGEPVPLRIAAAAAEIVPPLGSFIAGDRRDRRFRAVHDPLWVKTVVLADSDRQVAIMSVDLIGLMLPTIERIEQRMDQLLSQAGLPSCGLIVTSTHTHSGPDSIGLWGAEPTSSGVDPEYLERLIETAAQQVALAAGRLRPGRLEWAQGPFAANWVHNISQPDVRDDSLTIARLVDDRQRVVATLTNFACHPTILDAVHDAVSADFPGGLYRELAQAEPEAVHLFLQGAVGGWIQPDKGDQSFELADRYGRQLARQALRTLDEGAATAEGPLEFRQQTFSLPVANPGWQALMSIGLIDRPMTEGQITSRVAYLRIGSFSLVTHPGESSPEHALQSRAWLPSGGQMVVGLGQDMLGYILSEPFNAPQPPPHTEYLRSMSLGPETGSRMMAAIEQLIRGD